MELIKVPGSLVAPYEMAFFPETYEDPTAGADNTAAIQAAIDAAAAAGGGVVIMRAGREYGTLGGLIHKSRVRISGFGSTLKALPAWLSSSTILMNETTSGGDGEFPDSDLGIEGLTIDGDNVLRDSQSALAYLKCDRPYLRKVKLINVRYMGAAFAACREPEVVDSLFANCGKANPPVDPGSGYAEGGAAIWFGKVGATQNKDVQISGNTFRDNLWSALYVNEIDGLTISANNFRENGESTIFMNDTTRGYTITGNKIVSTILKHISAHAIELGGSIGVVSGNTIENTDGCGITCTDNVGVSITGNSISNPGQSLDQPQSSCILVISSVPAPNGPKAIQVSGNVCQSQDGKAYAAIMGSVQSGAASFTSVTQSSNNTLNGTWLSGSAVVGL